MIGCVCLCSAVVVGGWRVTCDDGDDGDDGSDSGVGNVRRRRLLGRAMI